VFNYSPYPAVLGAPLRVRLLHAVGEFVEPLRPRGPGDRSEPCVELWAALAADALAPGPGDVQPATLDAYRTHGAHCAAAGASLDTALGDVDLAVTYLLRNWWPLVADHDLSDMLPICARLEGARNPLRRAVNDGFVSWTAKVGAHSVARRAVIAALIAGRTPDEDVVAASRLVVAAAYCVVSTPAPTANDDAVAAALRVRLPAGDVLWSREDDLLCVLVPCPPGLGAEDTVAVDAVLQPVWRLPGATAVGATAPGRTLDELPAARRRAAEALSLARAVDRWGVVSHRSLVVERALQSSPDVRAELAGLVHRLAEHPHLVRTLRVLYSCDLERGRTASELGIARRTLTSRLDRVEGLTRIRPTSSRGVQVMLTALASSDLDRRR